MLQSQVSADENAPSTVCWDRPRLKENEEKFKFPTTPLDEGCEVT